MRKVEAEDMRDITRGGDAIITTFDHDFFDAGQEDSKE